MLMIRLPANASTANWTAMDPIPMDSRLMNPTLMASMAAGRIAEGWIPGRRALTSRILAGSPLTDPWPPSTPLGTRRMGPAHAGSIEAPHHGRCDAAFMTGAHDPVRAAIESGAMDSAGIRALLEGLHGESFAWSVACCRGDVTEATEVLQTAYVKVLSGQAQFEHQSSPRTWFFGVVLRTARERRRRALLTMKVVAVFARRSANRDAEGPAQ